MHCRAVGVPKVGDPEQDGLCLQIQCFFFFLQDVVTFKRSLHKFNLFLHNTYFETSGTRCSSLLRLQALGGFCGPLVEPLMSMRGVLDSNSRDTWTQKSKVLNSSDSLAHDLKWGTLLFLFAPPLCIWN